VSRQRQLSSLLFRFFLKFSSVVFRVKQRILQSESFFVRIFFAFVLLFLEIAFAILSLPLYFFASPDTFEKQVDDTSGVQSYSFRRRVSLGTILGASGMYAAKVLVVTAISFFLIGAPTLLADTQTWTFATPSDYTYDNAKLEITGGVVQMKNIGVPVSGATTNPGFDSNSTGWTYADWLQPAGTTASGTYVTSAGNPGGYVNNRLQTNKNKNKIVATYWRQPFTTTVASPDTATLNLDWKSITFTAPQTLVSYKLYAFIDTASGVPTLGQEVWSSPEITGTTDWSSISTIDITSKVPTARTYYLKIAARVATNTATNATNDLITGFDNVVVNWSKANVTYDTDTPSLSPNTSLTPTQVLSWSSFTETATKGGELYYQLSDDDGATWKYWNGSAWAAAGASNYTTATIVNTNISSFPLTNNKIRWKAFFSSNGTQQNVLHNIAIGYTQNTTPSLTGLSAAQQSSTGHVHVEYTLVDSESDILNLNTYEYSTDGSIWNTMTAATGDPAHSGVTDLTSSPSGVAHTFVWNAFADLGAVTSSSVQVRLRPNDGITSGTLVASSTFAVDYVTPVVSNVSASESTGSTNVIVTYDLSDTSASGLFVELEASADGGTNWTVPSTSTTGAVGSSVTTGTGKTITWNAGADYSEHQLDTMKVRVRAKDTYQNQGTFANSSAFSLDTLAPAVLAGADITSQPHAGESAVTVNGTFTEVNPDTNLFYVANGSDVYGSSTAGSSGTATPSTQAVTTAVLDGNDYFTKVKVVHTDTHGQSTTNENTSPAVAYKYVKPYTPPAPTVTSPGAAALDIVVNKHTSEVAGLEYAIYETSTNQFVQADETLGGSAVWQTIATWSTVNLTGLSSPLTNYSFETKSRNSNDGAHAVTSESSLSSAASIANTAPTIALGVIEQPVGMSYVTIAYTGTDPESNTSSLVAAEYSTDGSTWIAMTEKSGVGSNGRAGLSFTPGGASLMFAWNITTDLPGTELSNVYIRLRANDGVIDGNIATSSSFSIDTRAPVVDTISATQNAGSGLVTISYNLVDQTSSALNVVLEISDDNGSSWTVPRASATGAVGAAVTTGVGKTITWDAGADYTNHYTSSMLVRLTATDSFANAATPVTSSVFTIDTKTPVIATLSASQVATSDQVTISYDLSDDTTNGLTVSVETSPDGGTTWGAATTLGGNAGGGQSTGTNKLVTWSAGIDLPNTETTRMTVRVKTSDAFGNESAFMESPLFVLDTASPVGPTAFSAPTTTETTATLSWSNSTDAHFSYYEIWYGTSAGDVNSRSGTAQKWSTTEDPTLNTPAANSTTITGLTPSETYVIKIWAVDTFGHNTSPSSITITLPSPPVAVPPSTGGGTGSTIISTTLVKPILNPPPAFIRQTMFDVSGNTGTLSRVDVYDNGVFLKSITSSTTGLFQESFTFQEGGHSLTAKTVDQQSATSDFSNPVAFIVDITPPRAPEVTSPAPDQAFVPGEILVTGSAELSTVVEITLDNTATFFTTTGTNGLWSVKIPTTSAQTLGTHRLSVIVLDRAGNTSPATNLTLRRIQTSSVVPTETIIAPITAPATGGAVPTPAPVITPTTPTPTPVVIPTAPIPAIPSLPVTPAVAQNALEAVELPALPVPQILSVRAESLSVATGTVASGTTTTTPEDLLRFSGNAIPNQDVMIYIHSDQALIYRVKADRVGAWTLDHSQTALELTPGEHTIYAVSVNPDAQVKSQPSAIHRFTVARNFWSMMYRRLDIYSTSFTILALLSMMAWLYQIQQKRRVA